MTLLVYMVWFNAKPVGDRKGFSPQGQAFLRGAPIRNWLKRRAWRLDELLHGNMNCAVHMNLLRNELSQATLKKDI